MANQSPQRMGPEPGAALSDILTAIKNLVIALNGATQAFNQVNGLSTTEGITAATVVKTTPGRVASVSVIVSGTGTPGIIYDSASQSQVMPLWVIPLAAATNGQPYVVNLPTDSGILVVPSSGQKLSVSWS